MYTCKHNQVNRWTVHIDISMVLTKQRDLMINAYCHALRFTAKTFNFIVLFVAYKQVLHNLCGRYIFFNYIYFIHYRNEPLVYDMLNCDLYLNIYIIKFRIWEGVTRAQVSYPPTSTNI